MRKGIRVGIGKPIHFRPTNRNVTACGLVGAEYAAYDPRDVDCLRCRKTLTFRAATEKEKLPKQTPLSPK